MCRLVYLGVVLLFSIGYTFAQNKEALPSVINSSFVETRPLVSPSGKKVFFSRREHPDNTAGEKDDQDIWVADYSLDSLNPKVQNLGKLVNSRKLDALVSSSLDDQELIIYNNKDFDKAPLLRLRMKNGNWSKAEEITIKDFYNLSPYSDFYYSFSSKVILMALKRADSRGGQDIFVSFQISENYWSEPLSLGGVVNTRKDDFAPFLGSDGKSLFYASYGLKGEGKADIYYSYRLDDTWTNWSPPINIGKGVNSKNEEIYVSVSPDFRFIYFDSYSPEDKDRNVYKSELPKQFWPKKETPKVEPALVVVTKEPDTTQVASIAEVPAKETLIEPTPVKEVVQQEEVVQPEVVSNNNVIAQTASAPIYNSDNDFELLMPADELPEVMVFDHKEKISSNIYFDFNKATVRGDVRDQLAPILIMLKSKPEIKIELEGHADDKGTREANIDISYQRAQAVKKHLLKEGIDSDRIKLSWKGDTEPVASNDDEKDGRELNRRVEVFVFN